MQDIISKRISTKDFEEGGLSEEMAQTVKKELLKSNICPFGHRYSPRFVQGEFMKKNRIKRMASYGAVTGKPAYVFSLTTNDKYKLIDYGYSFQRLVLNLTKKEVDTIWLTTTFSKRQLRKIFHINDDKIIPAVVAIGPKNPHKHSNTKRHLDRKAFEEIFYDKSLNNPLKKEKASVYKDALEAIRLAPSHKNSQPWVVVQDGIMFHFYNNCKKDTPLKYIDMGIALYHFDVTRQTLGLKGDFHVLDNYKISDYDYIATYEHFIG